MKWLNEPSGWEHAEGTLRFTADPHTDFWRQTHCGEIHDNGHFYYQRVTGDFIADVRLTGDYHELYDQSGLMVRIDEKCWMKCGIEYVEGVWNISAVVTREWSDWSLIGLSQRDPVYIRVRRYGSAFEAYYSMDGRGYTLYRQAFLTDTSSLDVGLMIASPTGQGFTAVFEYFSLKKYTP
jgi:regulation of enolase protein 1 (concanavalin A-like superfamily)